MLRFSCEKALLQSAVNTTSRAVAAKSSIPALEGILLEGGDTLTLSGYNMQTGIRTIVDAQVQSPGRIVLSARLFGEMIRKMPDDLIVFAADENLSVHLTCGDASFEILGLSADDYPELPEVDDEFAKDVSEFDTLADFKKDLGEKLKERRETQNQRDFEAALMEQVMDNMEVEIPDAMVEYEADNLVNDMAQRIQAQGIPFDQYLAMTGMTMDIMREQAKAAALERVRRELALGAIVAAENITISDEELEEEYKRLAEQYHMDVDKVKAAVTADSIRKEQSYHKAEHVVYDSAKVGKAPAKKKSTKKKAEESAEGEEKPKKTARKGTSRKKVEETAEAAVEKTEE